MGDNSVASIDDDYLLVGEPSPSASALLSMSLDALAVDADELEHKQDTAEHPQASASTDDILKQLQEARDSVEQGRLELEEDLDELPPQLLLSRQRSQQAREDHLGELEALIAPSASSPSVLTEEELAHRAELEQRLESAREEVSALLQASQFPSVDAWAKYIACGVSRVYVVGCAVRVPLRAPVRACVLRAVWSVCACVGACVRVVVCPGSTARAACTQKKQWRTPC